MTELLPDGYGPARTTAALGLIAYFVPTTDAPTAGTTTERLMRRSFVRSGVRW